MNFIKGFICILIIVMIIPGCGHNNSTGKIRAGRETNEDLIGVDALKVLNDTRIHLCLRIENNLSVFLFRVICTLHPVPCTLYLFNSN